MRTVAVMHIADGGGPPQHVRPWLEALAERGPVEVVVPGPGRVEESYRAFARTTVVRYDAVTLPRGPRSLAGRPAALVAEAERFRRHFRRARPDLVVVVTSVVPTAVVGARLQGVAALVFAAEILDPGAAEDPGRRLLFRLLHTSIERTADMVVACSRTVERTFSGRVPSTTIYPGPALLPLPARDVSRAQLGVRPDAACVAVVGNISEGRGSDVAVRALVHIRERRPDVRLLLVGATLPRGVDERYRQGLDALIRRLGLEGNVSFTGFVDDVQAVYAAADVVLNPIVIPEAFGRAMLESLLAGTPVVASRVGAIPEVLRDGVDALLVPPGDVRALADATERLLGDAELGARLTAAGRARVLRRFSAEEARARFLTVADEVVARREERRQQARRRRAPR